MSSQEAAALDGKIAKLKEELRTTQNRRDADAAETHVKLEGLKQDLEGTGYDQAATKEKIAALGALVTGLREELAKYLDIQAKHTAALDGLSATVETLVKDLTLVTAAVTALQTAPPPIEQVAVPRQPEESPPPKKPSSKRPKGPRLETTGKGPYLWNRYW